jgi:hypothetical protein
MEKPPYTRFFAGLLFFVLDKKGINNAKLIQECDFTSQYISDIRSGRTTLSDEKRQFVLNSFGISLMDFHGHTADYMAELKKGVVAPDFLKAGKPEKRPKKAKPSKSNEPRRA